MTGRVSALLFSYLPDLDLSSEKLIRFGWKTDLKAVSANLDWKVGMRVPNLVQDRRLDQKIVEFGIEVRVWVVGRSK